MHELLIEARRVIAESIAAHPQGELFRGTAERMPTGGSSDVYVTDPTGEGQRPPVVDQWLPDAVDAATGPWRRLATLIGEQTDKVQWVVSYEHLTSTPELERFRAHYSYQRFIGPQLRSHYPVIESDEILVAFTVQAPHVLYPAHHHEPAEMYGIISGTLNWMVGETWSEVGPGDVIVHRPYESHAMHTGDEPVLTWAIWPSHPHASVYMPSHDPPGESMSPRRY